MSIRFRAMRVHAAFLANDARIRDGLVYAMGAFPESWDVPSLPATSRLTLVVVFELDPTDPVGGSRDFGVEMWRGSAGEQVATAQVTFGPPGSLQDAPHFGSVVIPFMVQFDAAGPREIRLTASGATIATVRFVVRLT
jgi:hypothetical protein